MLLPDGEDGSRTFHLTFRTVWLLVAGTVLLLLTLVLMAGSWWYLAARASLVDDLEAQVAGMEDQEGRIRTLAGQLEEVEQRYQDIRSLFGTGPGSGPSEVWLPPAGGRSSRRSSHRAATPTVPDTWPLTESGFITQGLLDAEVEHPGLDIAVPSDSYIRAAGGGTVVDRGEDAVYGRYVVLDHGDGYATLYGHASLILVERGARVRPGEVIALSGSTGRSTAPHLHFEVLLNSEAVDPLTMVTQPS